MCTIAETIIGKRLRLHRNCVDQAEELFSQVDQSRDQLKRFLPWVDKMKDVNDEKSFLKSCEESWEEDQTKQFGIYLNEGNQRVGSIGLVKLSWGNRWGEVGYLVFPQFEGKGYVSEALQLLELESFNSGIHRLEIICATENHRSRAVAERNQYHYEGCLREKLLLNGKFTDHLLFSKLINDFFNPC